MPRIIIMTLIAAGLLAGCTDAQVAKLKTVATAACKVDAVAQPIAVTVGTDIANLSGYADEAALAAAIDARAHTAIQQACASLGGTVAGEVTTSTAAATD
ncbi:hypothetical protein [Phaeospirillum tilakii]|uniref:Lipoprotein n=1 Tax=Phaeospirillum tilakii TaxID=741673 RepID=A0ABW5CE42_9PROT